MKNSFSEKIIEMRTLNNIISEYRNHFVWDKRFHFFDQIPLDKLEVAKQSFANLHNDEKPLVLMDETFRGTGRKGYILTDKGIYSNTFNDKITILWREIDAIRLRGSTIYVNDKRVLNVHTDEDHEYYMIHEIFRNISGKAITFDNIDKLIIFPNKCVNCLSSKSEEKLFVRLFGLPRGDWATHNLGLFGILWGLFRGSVHGCLLDYSISICNVCYLKLTGYEKNINLSLSKISKNEKCIDTNRYLSVELSTSVELKFWFGNIEYANEMVGMNRRVLNDNNEIYIHPAIKQNYESEIGRSLSKLEAATIHSWHLWFDLEIEKRLYVNPNIPKNKQKNANESYAKIFDASLFRSAKKGFVVTTTSIIWDFGSNFQGNILYVDVNPDLVKLKRKKLGDDIHEEVRLILGEKVVFCEAFSYGGGDLSISMLDRLCSFIKEASKITKS